MSEIPTSTDSIDHRRAEDVRGMIISVDVGFQRRVHGDQTHSSNDFGIVGDLHRSKDELRFQFGQFVEESRLSFRWECQRCRRSETKFVTVQQIEDRVLNHFRAHLNRTKSILSCSNHSFHRKRFSVVDHWPMHARTALATFPTPDWDGKRLLAIPRRSWFPYSNSCRMKSRMSLAILKLASSVCLKPERSVDEVLPFEESNLFVKTMPRIRSGLTRTYAVPKRATHPSSRSVYRRHIRC